MPHLISNLYEKNYTPFTAKLAPKNLWNRPVLERRPPKVSRFGADPRIKGFWRFIRSWVCQNTKLWYLYVLMVAFGVYNGMWSLVIGYYRRRNYEVSQLFNIGIFNFIYLSEITSICT